MYGSKHAWVLESRLERALNALAHLPAVLSGFVAVERSGLHVRRGARVGVCQERADAHEYAGYGVDRFPVLVKYVEAERAILVDCYR